jgi:hypothetical protein
MLVYICITQDELLSAERMKKWKELKFFFDVKILTDERYVELLSNTKKLKPALKSNAKLSKVFLTFEEFKLFQFHLDKFFQREGGDRSERDAEEQAEAPALESASEPLHAEAKKNKQTLQEIRQASQAINELFYEPKAKQTVLFNRLTNGKSKKLSLEDYKALPGVAAALQLNVINLHNFYTFAKEITKQGTPSQLNQKQFLELNKLIHSAAMHYQEQVNTNGLDIAIEDSPASEEVATTSKLAKSKRQVKENRKQKRSTFDVLPASADESTHLVPSLQTM